MQGCTAMSYPGEPISKLPLVPTMAALSIVKKL